MRKFLDDLGLQELYTYHTNDPYKAEKYRHQRKMYGFDESETWDLNIGFCIYLYERVSMFKETAYMDLKYYTYEYKEKRRTLAEMIEVLLSYLRIILVDFDSGNNEKDEMIDEVLTIWMTIHNDMSW